MAKFKVVGKYIKRGNHVYRRGDVIEGPAHLADRFPDRLVVDEDKPKKQGAQKSEAKEGNQDGGQG